MTKTEILDKRAEQIADDIWERANATRNKEQINHYEVIKTLVTRIVEQDMRMEALEERLDTAERDIRDLERCERERS